MRVVLNTKDVRSKIKVSREVVLKTLMDVTEILYP